MTLCDLRPGQRATIAAVTGRTALSLRLMEMGFTPGTLVQLVSTGPGGDPLLLRLRGYTLTLARREANSITLCQEATT